MRSTFAATATRSFGARIAMACVAGAGLSLCYPPLRLAALAPVVIAAYLAMLDGLSVKRAAYVGLAFGFCFFAVALRWLTHIFSQGAIGLWAIASVYPSLTAAVTATLWARRRAVESGGARWARRWLIAAATWTSFEYLRSEIVPPTFGWMDLGYSLADARYLSSIASIFGCYGLTFLIVALGAGVYEAALRAWSSRSPRPLLRPYCLPALAVYTALVLTPNRAILPAHPLHIRLVQANSEDDESLFGLSQRPGPRFGLLVWPEYSFVSDPRRQPRLWERLTGLPSTLGCTFVFGAEDQVDPFNAERYRNTAFVLDPAGRLIGAHVKNHPVHFIRDGVPGTDAQPIASPAAKLGVAICFDLDYPDVSRRLVEHGAEILVAPSDNPDEWGTLEHAQQEQMFQMRAIECGRWLAVADVAGGTFLVGSNGLVGRAVTTSGPQALDVTAGRLNGRTLFVRGGWRSGQAAVALLVVLGLALCRPGDRRGTLDHRGSPLDPDGA